VCIPPEQHKFEACFGDSVYTSGCCDNLPVSFYGFSNQLYTTIEAWSDILMTTHVPDGWYSYPGEAFVALFINGINVQVAARITCIP
jgi:hypothetical protein